MDRRRFVCCLGAAALAGCIDGRRVPGGSGTPTDTPEGAGTPERTETPENEETPDDDRPQLGAASLVDLDAVDRTLALYPLHYRSHDDAKVTVEFVETATEDRPARLRATLTNAGGSANTFRLAETPPFDGSDSGFPEGYTYRQSLYLAPTEDHDLVERAPSYERDDDGVWQLGDDPGQWFPDTVRLEPDETVEGEHVLVRHREGSGLPTGRYEFRGHDRALGLTAWRTSAPGPDGESRFAGASVPPLPDADEMAWYHAADETTPASLRPSVERAELPAGVTLSLVNHAREPLSGNSWNLYKLRDGEWFHVTPWAHTAVLRTIPPGERREWTLRAFAGHAPDGGTDGGRDVPYLGGGRYAFEAMFDRDGETHAALFDLVGDAVAVEPAEDVTTERDDERVVVRSPRRDDERPATLTVRPADDADRRLLPEQVMRRRLRGLRNTLPFFDDGIAVVELRTDRTVARGATGYDGETVQFRFEGQAYEATVREE